ncbi:MAG: AAA family ATPase [Aestuariivita sp.]|uniref:AAA family ATPase n=1 Tax=Aestuariivita sp. TaxID=1872407 RepID=UPI003BB1714D
MSLTTNDQVRSEDIGHQGDGSVRDLQIHTFLVTDIVGSSELFHRYPAEMTRTMDRHDALLDEVIRGAGGTPFKNTGDGVFAIFASPVAAVKAAVESHRRMQDGDWGATGRPRIRWGIHTGLARPRGGDYFGPALSGVSRLEQAANPDQILMSQTTLDLCAPDLHEAGLGVVDLGQFHFKGIEPLNVFQVTAEGLPEHFGDLGGKRETLGGNLPAEVNAFVGRNQEISALIELMSSARVVTLLGPGGIGKTRLATELARRLGSGYSGGAWLLQLSALEQGADLWTMLAATFSLDTAALGEKRAGVLKHLAQARALIVVDNCEHLLDEVADLVTTLRNACSQLDIVCTSQRALSIDGEVQFQVPVLSHDDETSTSVRLFVERARLIRPDFEPDAGDLGTILNICNQLENIPLAIEIAAGQLRRYPLSRIAMDAARPERMRSPTLRNSDRGQRTTLRLTFEWSYDLLDEISQKVLERLSVFSGQFSEEEALEVCGLDIEDEVDILDGIDELIDASLLTAQIEEDRRFRMLLTVRAFGREKLEERGLLGAFQRRHGEVYARRSAALAAAFETAAERDAVSGLQEELDNLRVAFERALESDLSLAARIAAPLGHYNYYHRGTETASWAERIMARPGSDDLEQAPLLLAAAASHSLHEQGDDKAALALLERGFRLEQSGVGTSRGWLSHVAGHVALWSGRPADFMTHHQRAVELAREQGDIALDIIDTSTAAYLNGTQKKEALTRTLVDHLNRLEAQVRQPSLVGYVHFGRAGLAMCSAPQDIVPELERAIQWAEIGGNMLGAQRARRALIDTISRNSEPEHQISLQTGLMRDLPQQGATIYVWLTINRLIASLAALERHEDVAVLAGALSMSPISLGKAGQSFLETARAKLGEVAFAPLFARGQKFDQKQARAYAEGL